MPETGGCSVVFSVDRRLFALNCTPGVDGGAATAGLYATATGKRVGPLPSGLEGEFIARGHRIYMNWATPDHPFGKPYPRELQAYDLNMKKVWSHPIVPGFQPEPAP